MREAVLHLYGHWHEEPTQPQTDAMFDRRDRHAAMLASPEHGGIQLDYHIGYVQSAPSPHNAIPADILIARNLAFDRQGRLLEADFRPDQGIDEYAVVLDHFVNRFRQRKVHFDGTSEEFASGIGVPLERVINPYPVQNYGNHKEITERDILEPAGMALQSHEVSLDTIESLAGKWGEGEFIFKPNSGSLTRGIQYFNSLQDLEAAIRVGKIDRGGRIQPFMDLTEPVPGLYALEPYFDAQLVAANNTNDRVREMRLHFFANTINGTRNIQVYPLLRTSRPGTKIMTDWTYIPIDPVSFSIYHSELVNGTIKIVNLLLDKTGAPHAYGCTDISRGISRHARQFGKRVVFAGDLNVRGPRLPDLSTPSHDVTTPAQKAFVRMKKTMALLALTRM